MPLPVGHSIAGYIMFDSQRLSFFNKKWQTILFFIFLANLPDIDFLPGFLRGNPNLYHQGVTHSLGAAILVGLLGGWIFSRSNKKFVPYFALIGAIYYSHLLLDFFNLDLRPPAGVMLFWPITSGHYMSPLPIFSPVTKSSDSITFFQSLLTGANFMVALKELFIMAPIVFGTVIYRKLRNRLKRRKSESLQLARMKYLRQRASWQVRSASHSDEISTFLK